MKEQNDNDKGILPNSKEKMETLLPQLKGNVPEKEISKPNKIAAFLGAAKKTIADNVLGGIPVVNILYNLHTEYNDLLDEEKQEAILNSLIERQGNSEENINKIMDFVCDPYGAVLYDKIKKISQKAPLNEESIDLFVNMLDEVLNSDFQSLFTKHSLYLELIDRLSIHAILLLKDHSNWPDRIKTSSGDGPYVQGRPTENNWFKDLAYALVEKGYDNVAVLEIVIREIYNNGLCYINQNGQDHDVCITTQGEELIKYLTR